MNRMCASCCQLNPPLPPDCPCCCGQYCPPPPLRVLQRWSHSHHTRHVCCSFTLVVEVRPVCDALTPVTVSPKCKAVTPSCGQVFSWEFYSGTVPCSFLRGRGGFQTVLTVGDSAANPCHLAWRLPGPGGPGGPASAPTVMKEHVELVCDE